MVLKVSTTTSWVTPQECFTKLKYWYRGLLIVERRLLHSSLNKLKPVSKTRKSAVEVKKTASEKRAAKTTADEKKPKKEEKRESFLAKLFEKSLLEAITKVQNRSHRDESDDDSLEQKAEVSETLPKEEPNGFYSVFHKLLKHYENLIKNDFYHALNSTYQSFQETTPLEEQYQQERKELVTMAEVDAIVLNARLTNSSLGEARIISHDIMEAYNIWKTFAWNFVLNRVKYDLSFN